MPSPKSSPLGSERVRVVACFVGMGFLLVPLAAICDTVTLELPVLESCTFCVALLPVLTFPKFTLLGESLRDAIDPKLRREP